MNAFILAGGQSTRMGRDKARLEFQGRPLVEHALDKLRACGFLPRIAGTRADLAGFAPVVADNYPRSGPLGGIEAALAASDAELNLFLPVDLPFLPVEFLRWMAERAAMTGAAATVPRWQGRPQPLCAVYNRALLPQVRDALASGDRAVARVMAHAAGGRMDSFHVEAVAAALDWTLDWSQSASLHRWFVNLNTPQDCAAWLAPVA